MEEALWLQVLHVSATRKASTKALRLELALRTKKKDPKVAPSATRHDTTWMISSDIKCFSVGIPSDWPRGSWLVLVVPGWSAWKLQWPEQCLDDVPESLHDWPPLGPYPGSQSDGIYQTTLDKTVTRRTWDTSVLILQSFVELHVQTAEHTVTQRLNKIQTKPRFTSQTCGLLYVLHVTSLTSLEVWVAFLMSGRSTTLV